MKRTERRKNTNGDVPRSDSLKGQDFLKNQNSIYKMRNEKIKEESFEIHSVIILFY